MNTVQLLGRTAMKNPGSPRFSPEEVLHLLGGHPAEALNLFLKTALSFGPDCFDCGGIYVRDRDPDVFRLKTVSGLGEDFIASAREWRTESDRGQLFMEGKPIAGAYAAMPLDLSVTVREEGLVGLAIFPISCNGEVIGNLNLGSHENLSFPKTVLEKVQRFCEKMGPTIS